MNIQLTKNFSLAEFIRSATTTKYGIDNTPNVTQIENMKTLCEMCLQPVSELYGKPIIINNGFRSPELMAAMKKEGYNVSATSQHAKGEAADIRDADKKNNKKLFDTILKYGIFDQLIFECNKGNINQEYPDWIHVSCKKTGNRKQVLKMVDGKTTHRNYDYVKWF